MSNLGHKFQIVVPAVDESVLPDEAPEEMVERVALLKARKIGETYPTNVILAADTTVALSGAGSWEILGKPESPEDATRMLRKLSGKTHAVFTGYAIICFEKKLEIVGTVRTDVTFDQLSDQEIHDYIATGEPLDKAGAYGIQGVGAKIVRTISGSYTNVVGLPLCEVVRDLQRIGLKI